jgi:hypothetical protein
MRELTEYEKQKWFDELNRFEMDSEYESPYFLFYGDELGEAFNGALYCTDKADYGLSDEFVAHAQIEVLTMYYNQLIVYAGQYGDEPEEVGLPPLNVVRAEFPDLLDEDGWPLEGVSNEACMRAWDWAMEWREEHLEETSRARRLEELKREQARLEKE